MGGGAILAGMLGGMAAAAVNTAINGGNFGYNIGMGALFGGIAGAIGPGVFEGMGGVVSDGLAWSNFLPAVKAGAVVGAAFGGLSTAIGGGNFFQNVAFGALGGGMGAAIGFGISAGVAKGWVAVKEWWNSMPGLREGSSQIQGTNNSQGSSPQMQGNNNQVTFPSTPREPSNFSLNPVGEVIPFPDETGKCPICGKPRPDQYWTGRPPARVLPLHPPSVPPTPFVWPEPFPFFVPNVPLFRNFLDSFRPTPQWI